MSDYGLFEASVVEDSAPDVQKRLAAKQLQAAIYDVRETYGRFLLGSTGLDEFEDRWHYSKADIRRTVEPHVLPVTGVMRRVHDAMKKEWKEAAFLKGAPFADYSDFADCVSKNKDKGDPDAYCGYIKHKVEDSKESSRRTACKICHSEPDSQKCAECRAREHKSARLAALESRLSHSDLTAAFRELADKTEPDQHIQQTDYHSDADLIPEDNFEGYLDSVDQGGPEKVQRDFGQRSGEDDWENTGRQGSIALDLYTDWARSNHLRVASLATLELYSANCSDDEFRVIDAAIRRTADEDEDEEKVEEDKEKLREDEEREDSDEDEGDEEDEGDDEGDEDEKSDDHDDDKGGPPWLTSAIQRVAAPPSGPGTYDPTTQHDRPGGSRSPFEELFNPTQRFDPNTGRDVPIDPGTVPVGPANRVQFAPGAPGQDPATAGAGHVAPAPGVGAGAGQGLAAPGGGGKSWFGGGDNAPAPGVGAGAGQNIAPPSGGNAGAGGGEGGGGWKANDIAPNTIKPGEYQIKPGDTLFEIAQGAGIKDYNDIAKANTGPDVAKGFANITDPNKINAGDKITIPGTPPPAAPVPNPADVTEGTKVESAPTSPTGALPEAGNTQPAPTSAEQNKPIEPKASKQLKSYFQQYYGIPRLAAEEDEEGGPPPGESPASEPPPQDPSAAPPAPGSDQAPQAPPDDQPPVDPNTPPQQMENQPAEDHLLDTAGQAVSQMIDRETQEYQQIIDPLSQALQAIQYAQQVEEQMNPIDVTPPQGTVDVGPQDAATGAPQAAIPPQPMQQQAYRIARHFGMTQDGYHMMLEAMGRKHYQTVADAIAGLPVEHRGSIASSMGDMFAEENPNFRHEAFFRAAGVPPMRTAGVPWNETKNAPLREHERYDLDPGNWEDRDLDPRNEGLPPWEGHYDPAEWTHGEDDPFAGSRMMEHYQNEPHSFGRPAQPNRWDPNESAAYDRGRGEFKGEGAYGSPGVPPGMQASRGRLGFNRQGAAPTLVPQQTMDTFKFPGAGKTVHPDDNLSITPDMTDLTPPKKKAAWDFEAKVMDQWTKWDQGRAQKGLPELPTEDKVKSFANETGVGTRGVNTVMKNLGVPKAPKAPAAPAAPKVKAYKEGSFFTRRVPGWTWDDHLAAYKTNSAAPFTCKCGSMFDVPAYYNCRCGAVFNAYPIGQGGDERTASVDMYLCREINVRDGMMMEGSIKTACDECGHSPCACETEWVEDEDREDADAPHAPGKTAALGWQHSPEGNEALAMHQGLVGHAAADGNWHVMDQKGRVRHQGISNLLNLDGAKQAAERAMGHRTAAIGEDDHSVVYRDGDRFCSKCNALLWDPNVHHCPAKQAAFSMALPKIHVPIPRNATRAMFGEMKSKDDRDDEPTTEPDKKKGDDDASTLPEGMQHKVKEHEGTSGEEVEEHVKGKDKKATRVMFGDWTVYDDDIGGGARRPPSTVVHRPPEDWARRMPEQGPSSQWRPPIFQ